MFRRLTRIRYRRLPAARFRFETNPRAALTAYGSTLLRVSGAMHGGPANKQVVGNSVPRIVNAYEKQQEHRGRHAEERFVEAES
jgi:hypothetical protein